MNNNFYQFFLLLIFISVISSCAKNTNRVYFTIDPIDPKILLPVQLDDSITANLVFDILSPLVLDSSFCAARPYLSLYSKADSAIRVRSGVAWTSTTTPGLFYETSKQKARIGNSNQIYNHIQVFNLKKYMNNDKLDGIFNIPPNDTIHVWELNFEHNYLEIHTAIDFQMPNDCFLLPIVENVGWEKSGGENAIKVKLPIQIKCADGDTLTMNRIYYIDTGMPWDIVLDNTAKTTFFNNKKDAVWTQQGGRNFFRHYTVNATMFDSFSVDSLRIYLFDRSVNGIQYLIGLNFLKRFNVFFDMKNRQVGLQPIKNFQRVVNPGSRRFYYSTIQTPKGKFIVNKVADFPNNYFKTAGLQEGDEIVMVNELPYSDYSFDLLPINTPWWDEVVQKKIIIEDRCVFREDTLLFDIIHQGKAMKIIVSVDKNMEQGD